MGDPNIHKSMGDTGDWEGHGLHVLADSLLPRNDFSVDSYGDKERWWVLFGSLSRMSVFLELTCLADGQLNKTTATEVIENECKLWT